MAAEDFPDPGPMRDKRRGIKVRVSTPASRVMTATLVAFLILTVLGFLILDTKGVDIRMAARQTLQDFKKMLAEPMAVHITLLEALYELLITVCLGFLTTLFGTVLALAGGLLAARNLSRVRLSSAIKGFAAFVRAVPTVLWVLIFAIGAGLGATAAVIGMTFHSFSYLVKAYSESFETIDPGVIEALEAGGAGKLQIAFQAVIPSSLSSLISWTFLRFEINFVTSVAMGAAAGAGGIGFSLYMAGGQYFNIREVGFITYLILAVAIAFELAATRLKAKNLIAK